MPETASGLGAIPCPSCGTEIAPRLLTCPTCRKLVHSERLKELAAEAGQAERDGQPTAALVAWNRALELLPTGSRQHEMIAARVAELGRQLDASPGGMAPPAPASDPARSPGEKGWAGAGGAGVAGLGALGLALWKFKFLAVFALTKAKFLLLGLTKASTLLSMLLSLGVYWAAFGWWFALGLVVSIYIHEMGHVAALRHYGIRAGAPMFIPGVGAVVRLQQALTDPRQDARVGLAGPLWGLGAALAAYAMAGATGAPIWAAIARVGAWVNLFNLLPFWQLDGGRAFRSLARGQRWLAATAIAVAWSLSEESLLVLLLIGAVLQALSPKAPTEPDRVGLLQYVALVAVLSAMTLIPVQLPG
jgi:Zn-dependent protease